MASLPDPQALRGTYDRQAEAFDARRGRTLFEAGWLERFAALLPAKARVLDLGCGAGEPIAQWFIEHDFRITGMDLSGNMLALARHRWPDQDWRQVDMRALESGETWDGIICWNSFFHLTPEEQINCLPRLSRAVEPGGPLMVTVGTSHGAVAGTVGSEQVYHASLSPGEYATLLEANDMQLRAYLAEDATCNGHSVLLAQRLGRGT